MICPITNKLIILGGMIITNEIFEYSAIKQWLSKNNTHPISGSELNCKNIWELKDLSYLTIENTKKYINIIINKVGFICKCNKIQFKNNCNECNTLVMHSDNQRYIVQLD